MVNTIIACLIANVLTIAIIGIILYSLYKKNEKKIDMLRESIDDVRKAFADAYKEIGEASQAVDEINDAVSAVKTTLEEIKDKFPFKANASSARKTKAVARTESK